MAAISLAAVCGLVVAQSEWDFGIGQKDQVTKGLVAYWAMRNSGTTVFDEWGTNNGGASNSVTFSSAAGVVGNGYTLDGTNFIQVANSSSLALAKEYTITFWLKTPTAQTGVIVAKGDTALRTGVVQVYVRSTVPRVQTVAASVGNAIDGAFTSWATSPYDSAWHHVCIVRDNATCNGYMDGVLVEAGSLTNNYSINGSDPLYIGKRKDNGADQLFYSGSLDEVRIYNRALTAAEVKQLYRMGAIPKGIK